MEAAFAASTSPMLLVTCITLSLVLAASLLLVFGHGRGRRKKAGLPPGPPAVLFLARFFALRRSIFDLGPLLRELHAKYGPVISIRLFRAHVFVADRRVAHRVLVQGGATFADRPPDTDPNKLFSLGGISSAPYGPYWRLVRRNLAAEALSPERVGLLAPARRWACDALVSSLRRAGTSEADQAVVEVRPFLRRAIFELLAYMCFGARFGQEQLNEFEELQHRVLHSITTFPVFAFFPAATKRLFRSRWEACVAVRRRQDELYVPLIRAARGDGDPPCYASSLLAVRVAGEGNRPLTDFEMVSLCSEFLNGGTDTTVTLLEWIMAELVNHPDVQAKVYNEVKAKPEFNDGDLQAMPYLKAVVLEGLRLHPPGHFLLPHGVQSDADIGGYAVPKGIDLNFMVAEIGRDATVWKAAREFRPERFLDGGEGCGVDITGSREIKMMPFGAGRRMCPGYALGMHHAEYFVARMVRELECRPAADGAVVDMAEALDFTVVMKHPLRARIIARNTS